MKQRVLKYVDPWKHIQNSSTMGNEMAIVVNQGHLEENWAGDGFFVSLCLC